MQRSQVATWQLSVCQFVCVKTFRQIRKVVPLENSGRVGGGIEIRHFESHLGPVQVLMVSRSLWLATALMGIVCVSAVYGRVGVDVSTAVSVYVWNGYFGASSIFF